jgi:ATP-dependent helicase/nuclease subunit B
MQQRNIFNIPNNYHFFHSLFDFLNENFGDIANIRLFLPNRRSCREFKRIFFQQNNAQILPKIKAISDISYEDFFDLSAQNQDWTQILINELLENKVLSKTDYLFFLTKEIQKLSVFGENLEFDQAFRIATNLQKIFEELEAEEITLEQISEIDDSDLSLFRQFNLEFLKNFYSQIKNSLLKKNIISASFNQNLIIKNYIKLLEKSEANFPIIIAGSTGSLPFSRKLIKTIFNQKNGHVVLYGLENKENSATQNHPQFFSNHLISFLGIDKNIIKNIAKEEFLLSPKVRHDMVSMIMVASDEALKWQEAKSLLDLENLKKDLEENLQLIEAKNSIEEAKIITSILEKNQHLKTALISNNDDCLSLVRVMIEDNNISFNDARSLGIKNAKIVNFLLLVLELITQEFNSSTLLAILKNPLCVYSKNKDLVNDFEIKILRQERSASGISAIREKIKLTNDKDLENFFNKFCEDVFKINFKNNYLTSQVENLIHIIENLSKQSFEELLSQEESQVELFELFEKLKLQGDAKINPKNLLNVFNNLFAQISYFDKSDSESSLQILSTIEARLLNFDLVIIASLNEGDFPGIEGDNYLGKKIKSDLGIDKNLKKLGQNSYDFCNYLANKSVILTRSKNSKDLILLESPFLLKLRVFCNKLGITLSDGKKYFSLPKNLNHYPSLKITPTHPKPALEVRPNKISITEISKLISDPYSIYAKKILKLKELKEIDYEPSVAEFGSFVHKALEEFVKDKNDFLSRAKIIFKDYFVNQEAELIWWPKFENIFNNFLDENTQFDNCKNYLEMPLELRIGEILISGKVDRLILQNNEIGIFDYKTGLPATKNEVILGRDPQLTVAALALVEGAFNLEFKKISSLNYWKLSALSKSEIKKICGDSEEITTLIYAAKAGLTKLFEHFSKQENGYISAPDKNNYQKNEYWHLARITD